MKTIFIYAIVALVQLNVLSIASAESLNGIGWHGSASVQLRPDGSAELQTACGFISIKHWNDEGKPMSGLESSALPSPNRFTTPVSVTAVLEENGDLELTIGDEPTEVLSPGYEPSVICG